MEPRPPNLPELRPDSPGIGWVFFWGVPDLNGRHFQASASNPCIFLRSGVPPSSPMSWSGKCDSAFRRTMCHDTASQEGPRDGPALQLASCLPLHTSYSVG